VLHYQNKKLKMCRGNKWS